MIQASSNRCARTVAAAIFISLRIVYPKLDCGTDFYTPPPCSVALPLSFVKAFNEGSLKVQSAVDVKGLDYDETTTLTGTSESASLEMNHAWYDSQATSTQGGGLVELPAIGGLFFTFPQRQSLF